MQVQIKGTWNVTGKLNRRFDLSESETDPHRKSQTHRNMASKWKSVTLVMLQKSNFVVIKLEIKNLKNLEKIWKNSHLSLFVFLYCQKSNAGTEEGICA